MGGHVKRYAGYNGPTGFLADYYLTDTLCGAW